MSGTSLVLTRCFSPQLPDDAADPAQDPNNQGEDEFEEAELERPDFEEKPGASDKFKEHNTPEKEGTKEKPAKVIKGIGSHFCRGMGRQERAGAFKDFPPTDLYGVPPETACRYAVMSRQ